MAHRTPRLAVALATLLASTAAAALSQPDGTVIPQGGALRSFLDGQSYGGQQESIDPLNDAATTPETFVPGCALTFTVIGRGAGQDNSFGWYNVTGQKPAASQLYEFIRCNDDVGASRVLDIASDPRWTGGEIGFFQATTEGASGNCVQFPLSDDPSQNPSLGYVFYSETRFNDDNTGPNSYVHLLIMDSRVFPNAFYFGWEDLFAGGDNDFEDLLMRVEGIACSGAGEPCAVPGQQGECAVGLTTCRNGALVCEQRQQPTAETCNAADDDCNGQADEGDLCGTDEVCFRGRCEPRCGGGEFSCPQTLVCNTAGLCVDPDCAEITCPEGELCVGGNCRGACQGIVCPHGQLCRRGACVDPCDGVTCDPGYSCVDGACQRCSCGAGTNLCQGGLSCQDATQRCVDPACATTTCGAGTHCVGGACVGDCEGAVCPAGERCDPTTARCILDPNQADGGAGTGGSGAFDGGFGAFGGQGATGGSAAATGAGGSASFGNTADTEADAGCGCRAPAPAAPSAAVAGLAALLGAALRRRPSRGARRR